LEVFDAMTKSKWKMKSQWKWKEFGRHVRQKREVRGYSIRKAADALKIPHSTWVRAERGKAVVVPVFMVLCKWMHRDPFQYDVRKLQK
jgi:transcriptional regulator with XRE-family HTH domain